MRLTLALAWRNLWRNTRRTLLAAGAIAFMVLLLIFALSMQFGGYDTMIDHGAGVMNGHAQVQHPEYVDNPRMRFTLPGAERLAASLRELPDVRAVTPRAVGTALASAGEASYGALVVGVDPAHEGLVSWLPEAVLEGRYLQLGDHDRAVIGRILARNLGLTLGDELVLLGVTPDDGMAVLAATVVGIVESQQAELDRTLAHVPLGLFQEAFEMPDAAHTVAIMYEHHQAADAGAIRQVIDNSAGDAETDVALWRRLLPEIETMIAMDKASAFVMYGILVALVAFSIANTFVMMIFERTQEFGTLLAMGARPGTLVGTVQLETLLLALLGAGIGVVLGVLATYYTGLAGISLGAESQQIMAAFQMPERMYFGVQWSIVVIAPLLMIAVTQIAAFIAGRRVHHMRIVDAVREEL
ncbi:MAG: FtsX-like permease family protein [Pseudomonadota bacterium]